MALTAYLNATARLLQNPAASPSLYSTADLTTYVNTARSQVAAESESIRAYLTLSVSSAAQQYAFSLISLTNASSGTASVLTVRQAAYGVGGGSGTVFIPSRPFPWFNQYRLMDPNPIAGPPAEWAQLGQGGSGSLFLNLLDAAYKLSLDCVCLPNALVSDADAEAIPYPWTDAVPFFAAFYALLSAQRRPDATEMYRIYSLFMSRARGEATPGVLPWQWPQTPDKAVAPAPALAGGAAP